MKKGKLKMKMKNQYTENQKTECNGNLCFVEK